MSNKPSVRKRPLFYGWVIVAVLALCNSAAGILAMFNFGLFFKPMGEDIGATRAMFGWTQSIRQVTNAVTSPITGRLLDKYGARIILPVAMTATCGLIFLLAFVNAPWQMLLIFGAMGLFGLTGSAGLITSVPIAKWFVRKRGRAMAFAFLGSSIGAIILVPLTQVFIGAYGWRGAWASIAIMCFIAVVPISLIFLRRNPEDMGTAPDGDVQIKGVTAAPIEEDGYQWTVREATRSPVFWRLMVAFSFTTLAQTSLGVHRVASFIDRGIDPRLVALAIAADATAATVSTLFMGFLYERLHARILGGASLLLMALAIFFTIIATDVPKMFLATITFGTSVSGISLLQNNLWAEYYGRRNVGAIRGLALPVVLILGATGPPVAGYVFDFTGGYTPVWSIGIGLMVSGALLLLFTRKPRTPESSLK